MGWKFNYGNQELLLNILENLTPKELTLCCEVSRHWFDTATEEELWQLPNKTMAMIPLNRRNANAPPLDRMSPPTGAYKVPPQ